MKTLVRTILIATVILGAFHEESPAKLPPKEHVAYFARELRESYKGAKFFTPIDIESGLDVSLACLISVYHGWYKLLIPVLNSLDPNDRQMRDLTDLEESIAQTREELDIINEFRPGITSVLEEEIEERRRKNLWPARPTSLYFGFGLEYVEELMACTDESFLSTVNSRLPFHPNIAPSPFTL